MKPSLLQLHTEPFTIEREWESDGIPVLSASVSIPRPIPSERGVFRRIHRFYDLQARAFFRYCEHWLFPEAITQCQSALASSAPLPRFHTQLNYHITYNEGGFWSLYTQSCEPDPSGRPLFFRHGDTWDLAAGYPVSLSSFFLPRVRWKSRLLTLAAQEIQTQEHAGISLYHPEWRKLLRRHFNARNYYLTPEGIAFFFPMHSIAPPAERIPVFLLPYRDTRFSGPPGTQKGLTP